MPERKQQKEKKTVDNSKLPLNQEERSHKYQSVTGAKNLNNTNVQKRHGHLVC